VATISKAFFVDVAQDGGGAVLIVAATRWPWAADGCEDREQFIGVGTGVRLADVSADKPTVANQIEAERLYDRPRFSITAPAVVPGPTAISAPADEASSTLWPTLRPCSSSGGRAS
jgi:hypothetical protein